MTAATIDYSDSAILANLRSLIIAALAPGTECIQAYSNQVPEPKGLDFVVMTPLLRTRLSTNIDEDDDIIATNPDGSVLYAGQHRMRYSADFGIQLDVHGPASAGNAVTLSALGWNDWANQELRRRGNGEMQLLYATDARQVPFVSAEQAWEYRWVVEWHVQAVQTVSVFQDFFDEVDLGLINVDVVFPP